MQRRLGLFLAVFASGVLVFSALQQDVSVLTVRQAWLNLAVAAVASLILVWPFPELVQVFCGILRFTAPVSSIFFLVRGRWQYLPPMLLLGLVFHVCMWVAEEVREGRGPRGMAEDVMSLIRRLSEGEPGRAAPGPARPPKPFEPDRLPTSGGTFTVRRPDEPSEEEPGEEPEQKPGGDDSPGSRGKPQQPGG